MSQGMMSRENDVGENEDSESRPTIMNWKSPELFFAIWIPIIIGVLLVIAHRRRMATAQRFADRAMLQRLMPTMTVIRPWLKGTLLVLGLILLIAAAARPRFGQYYEEVSRRGVDVFVLLDVSRSMLAEDVAPNRLERAKSDIQDLLQRLQTDRVGLVAFAGAAAVKSPLTNDHTFFRLVLDEVGPHSAPRGGSLIGDAIRKAVGAMDQQADRDRAIVLITDGEDHDSFPEDAAQLAADANIRIFAVGLGDSGDGSRIPVRGDDGQLKYLQHDGQEIWSKMDEELLKRISLKTGGAYIPARTRVYDLGQVYEDHISGLKSGEMDTATRRRFREQYQWFAMIGFVLLLTEMLIPSYQTRIANQS